MKLEEERLKIEKMKAENEKVKAEKDKQLMDLMSRVLTEKLSN